jgi:predicted dehydrogenase
MGRWHAAAVARAGHAVAAIIDSDESRAAALAVRYPGSAAGTALAAVRDADVVHVCTPLGTHMPLAREALAMGAHVIVEKPLAETVKETRELLALAAANARLIIPVHQFLFQRGVQQAIGTMPALGRVLHIDFTACTAGAFGLSESEHARVAREILPHPLSLLARLVSPTLAGADWQVRYAGCGELRVHGELAGATLSILISTGGRPTTNILRLIGTRGTIQLDLFHGFAMVARGRATRAGKVLQPFLTSGGTFYAATRNLVWRAAAREPAYPGLRRLIAAFYAAAQSGTAAPISPDELLAVAIAAEHINSQASVARAADLYDRHKREP